MRTDGQIYCLDPDVGSGVGQWTGLYGKHAYVEEEL